MEKTDGRYRELLEEYRIALGFLSGLRILYPATCPKVVAAGQDVTKLEQALATHGRSHGTLIRDGIEPRCPAWETRIRVEELPDDQRNSSGCNCTISRRISEITETSSSRLETAMKK